MRSPRYLVLSLYVVCCLLSASPASAQQGPSFVRDYVYGPTGQVAVTIEPDLYPPTPPSQTTATLSGTCATDGIDVSWTSATDIGSGVASYNVYRNGGFLTNVLADTFYHDGSVSALTKYHYHTTAIDVAGNQSPASPESNSVSYPLCTQSPVKQPGLAEALSQIHLFGPTKTPSAFNFLHESQTDDVARWLASSSLYVFRINLNYADAQPSAPLFISRRNDLRSIRFGIEPQEQASASILGSGGKE